MRRRITMLIAAAAIITANAATSPHSAAQDCYDGDCGGEGCYDGGYCDGGYCDGYGGCGHGGGRGLFGGHGHGHGNWKGPCYWCGGCTGRCCDCGYMLPVRRAQWYNWNRNYAYTDYGATTALVVPPTANMQTNWGWGVGSSRISRIDHQFQRNYPGSGPFGGPPRPTPVWPSDTTQFGVYYVRGPW